MPTVLSPDLVIPAAQNIFDADVISYFSDFLYGTNRCSKSLAQITAEMLLIIGATNNCGSATITQQNCFLSNLNTIRC